MNKSDTTKEDYLYYCRIREEKHNQRSVNSRTAAISQGLPVFQDGRINTPNYTSTQLINSPYRGNQGELVMGGNVEKSNIQHAHV
jgi:hypothetical protein